ncbi:Ribonuclease H-like domain containing protein [Trema orientale]|uniref:Ribonuclease H-like domain containing protein n=1 Tax=Trema orientale TaxID=63057 RepID=A0A2P5EGH7_TREOI|nr:Ribonuclease H-like domain containing protein [Trema orientale]
MFTEMGYTGIGGIVRDYTGKVVFAGSVKILGSFDPLTAELLALREGLVLVSNFGLQIHVLESDSSNAISLMNSATNGLAAMDIIAGYIKSLMSISGYGSCSFIPKSRNEAASKLTKLSGSFSTLMYWHRELPNCLCDVVAKDIPF